MPPKKTEATRGQSELKASNRSVAANKAMDEYRQGEQLLRERTEKLRAERLARDAAAPKPKHDEAEAE